MVIFYFDGAFQNSTETPGPRDFYVVTGNYKICPEDGVLLSTD
jgi:hypothetical protein